MKFTSFEVFIEYEGPAVILLKGEQLSIALMSFDNGLHYGVIVTQEQVDSYLNEKLNISHVFREPTAQLIRCDIDVDKEGQMHEIEAELITFDEIPFFQER